MQKATIVIIMLMYKNGNSLVMNIFGSVGVKILVLSIEF